MRTADPEKEEQTRNEIIASAQTLFQKFGLDKTTMEDIAEATGKGKSTLYYYFKSKEEVFHAVARKEKAEVFETVKTAIRDVKSPSKRLKILLLTYHNTMKKKLTLYPIFLREGHFHRELYRVIRQRSLAEDLALIKSILLDGIRVGEFKSITKEDCGGLAAVSMAVLRGIAAESFVVGELSSELLSVDVGVDVFVRGLR
jgi:AcrR family transcriptional regulator